ncbi:MAG: glycosyltransferase, partial [Pseudomonadota bacterium]
MKFRRTILQVIPTLNEGGAERSTVEIAEAVVRAGGRALVATYGGGMAPTIEAAGGEILPLPVHSKNPFTIRLNADRLARLIRRFNVDIVHARSRAPAWSAYWAAKKTGTSL